MENLLKESTFVNTENNGLFPKKQWKENMVAKINNLSF